MSDKEEVMFFVKNILSDIEQIDGGCKDTL
jgi:hypothetical protein